MLPRYHCCVVAAFRRSVMFGSLATSEIARYASAIVLSHRRFWRGAGHERLSRAVQLKRQLPLTNVPGGLSTNTLNVPGPLPLQRDTALSAETTRGAIGVRRVSKLTV